MLQQSVACVFFPLFYSTLQPKCFFVGNCTHLLDPSTSNYHWGLYVLAYVELPWSLNTFEEFFLSPDLTFWSILYGSIRLFSISFSKEVAKGHSCHFWADFWVGIVSCCVQQWKLNIENCKAIEMHYCCVCKNYRGKVIEDVEQVFLHHFMADQKITSSWEKVFFFSIL